MGPKDTLHPTWPIVVWDWHLQLGYNGSQDHTAVVDDLKLQTGNTMKHLPSKCSNCKHWHRSSICTILYTYADASFQFPIYYYTSLISINVNFNNSIHLLNLKDAKHTCTQAIQIGAPGDSARKFARWTVLTVWPWDSYNVKALQCKGSLFMLVYRFVSCRAKTLSFFSSMWECDDGWLCMGGYLPKEIAQLLVYPRTSCHWRTPFHTYNNTALSFAFHKPNQEHQLRCLLELRMCAKLDLD